METWQAKLVVLFAMFLIAFVSGVIPIKLVDVLRRGGKNKRHARTKPVCLRRSTTVPYSAVGLEDEDNSDARGRQGQGNCPEDGQISTESARDTVADVDGSDGKVHYRRTTADCVLDLLNCFAGGVFLATSLLHLLPDVRSDIAKVSEELGGSLRGDFPLAEFITSIGFFIVMLIEQLVLYCQKENHSGGSTNRCLGTSTEPISNTSHHLVKSDEESDSGITSWVADETQQSKTPLLSQSGVHSCCGLPGASVMPSPFLDTDERRSNIASEPAIIAQYGSVASSQKIRNYSQHEKLHNSTQIAEVGNVAVGETSCSTGSAEQSSRAVSSSRSFILLLAVSIHTVFEGLAIGLQNSSSGIWTLFIAVALHKAIMGFTSGLRFAESLSSRRQAFAYVLVFAVSSPIGIGIGTAVSESGSGGAAADISSAILQGLATGTFFYVTFFEVLNEQLAHNDDHSGHHDEERGVARANETGRGNVSGLIKVLAVAIGFACITILELMSGD